MYNLLTKLPLLLVVGLVIAFFAFEALSIAFTFALGHFEAMVANILLPPCPFLCSPCFGQI